MACRPIYIKFDNVFGGATGFYDLVDSQNRLVFQNLSTSELSAGMTFSVDSPETKFRLTNFRLTPDPSPCGTTSTTTTTTTAAPTTTSTTTSTTTEAGAVPDFYIGGQFMNVNGQSRAGGARLYNDGGLDTTFNPQPFGFDDIVHAIAEAPDGKVYYGGRFTSYKNSAQNRLIRLNSTGTKDAGFDIGSGFNLRVSAIKVQSDGKVLVGGNFSSYNGASVGNLVRLNTDGTLDASINVGGHVYAIALDVSGNIYVTGDFSGVIKKYNSAGTLDSTFESNKPSISGIGYAIEVNQAVERVFVGGDFNNVWRMALDGGSNTSFTVNGTIYALKFNQYSGVGVIFVGGSFNVEGSQNIVGFGPGGGVRNNFSDRVNGTVRAMTFDGPNNEYILLAGEFTTFAGDSHQRLVRVTTQTDTTPTVYNWSGYAGDTVWSVATSAHIFHTTTTTTSTTTTTTTEQPTTTTTTTTTTEEPTTTTTTTTTTEEPTTTTTTTTTTEEPTTTTTTTSSTTTTTTQAYSLMLAGGFTSFDSQTKNGFMIMNYDGTDTGAVMLTNGVFGGGTNDMARFATATSYPTIIGNQGPDTAGIWMVGQFVQVSNRDGASPAVIYGRKVTESGNPNVILRDESTSKTWYEGFGVPYPPQDPSYGVVALNDGGAIIVGNWGQYIDSQRYPGVTFSAKGRFKFIPSEGEYGKSKPDIINFNATTPIIRYQGGWTGSPGIMQDSPVEPYDLRCIVPHGENFLVGGVGVFELMSPTGSFIGPTAKGYPKCMFLDGGVPTMCGDDSVRAIAVKPNGKIISVGGFKSWAIYSLSTPYNNYSFGYGIPFEYWAMHDSDFTPNQQNGFIPDNKPNAPINTVVADPSGNLIFGGEFTNWAGTSCGRIWSYDNDFNARTTFHSNLGTGFNGTVRKIIRNPADGSLIVIGDFTQLNGVDCYGVAKISSTGVIDTTFRTNVGTKFNSANVTAAIIFDNNIT